MTTTARPPAAALFAPALRLRPGVRVESADADLRLHSAGRETTLRALPPLLHEALVDLGAGRTGSPRLSDSRVQAGLRQLMTRLGHLAQTSWSLDDVEVMAHQGTTRDAGYVPIMPNGDQTVRLNRFALLRSSQGTLVLECPLTPHRFLLTSPTARTLAVSVGTPTTVADLLDTAPEVREATAGALAHWVGAGVVEVADTDGTFGSDDDVLQQWDFHDLLMHSRTRSGRFDEPLGALGPRDATRGPLPAVTDPRPDALVTHQLPRPDPVELARQDPPLGQVLDQRRSIRDYADEAITRHELGVFLFRTVRDRARFDPADPAEEPKLSRPYPSGGGLYEHELYLTVRRCTGLAPGIYRYDSLRHALELINDEPADRTAMLNVAAAATGHPSSPDVLLTLTARFQRMTYRYRSIAYANILRNTGAIYQTMYLVATAMDLAPCGLGNGDADLAARVLGLDYLRESSVGDVILGRRRPKDVFSAEPIPGWTVLDTATEPG